MDVKQRKLDGVSDFEVVESLKSIKERVKRVCALYPSCTGNYNLLITRYFWFYYGRKFGIPFSELLKLPSSESVSRAFRKLVEQGEVTPSGKIKLRRESRERVMREANNEW